MTRNKVAGKHRRIEYISILRYYLNSRAGKRRWKHLSKYFIYKRVPYRKMALKTFEKCI